VKITLWRNKELITKDIELLKFCKELKLKNEEFLQVKNYTFAPLSKMGILEMGQHKDLISKGFKYCDCLIVLSVDSNDTSSNFKHVLVKKINDQYITSFENLKEIVAKGKGSPLKITFRKFNEILII
jgi:hypothetical protein